MGVVSAAAEQRKPGPPGSLAKCECLHLLGSQPIRSLLVTPFFSVFKSNSSPNQAAPNQSMKSQSSLCRWAGLMGGSQDSAQRSVQVSPKWGSRQTLSSQGWVFCLLCLPLPPRPPLATRSPGSRRGSASPLLVTPTQMCRRPETPGSDLVSPGWGQRRSPGNAPCAGRWVALAMGKPDRLQDTPGPQRVLLPTL